MARKTCLVTLVVFWTCQAQVPSGSLDQLRRELMLAHGTVNAAIITTAQDDFLNGNAAHLPSAGTPISAPRLMHKVPRTVRKLFADANRYSKKGDHVRAIEELKTATQRDPEFADAWDQLAIEYGDVNQFTDGAAALHRSLEIDPNTWTTHYNLAICLYRTGDAAGAEQQARIALRQSSGAPMAQWFLGFVLYQHTDTQRDGLRYLRSAAQTVPEAREFLREIE